jgi:mRNA interferase HigB
MRIIARRAIISFYERHADSETALEDWFNKTKNAQWTCFADMRKTFNSADSIGDQHYVFNIKGNDYRLVAVVKFSIKTVYIRHILTHSQYDKTELK